jgi:rhodanese-related sulfurtransferase
MPRWRPIGSLLNPLAVEAWQLQGDGALERYLVVDLREPEAHRRAHLPGATCLPYGRFQAEALGVCAERGPVLVVCAGGARSAEMAVWLRGQGVAAAYLVGGMAGWTGALDSGVKS